MRKRITWLAPTVRDPDLARRQYLLNLVLLGLAGPGILFAVVMAVLWVLGKAPITGMLTGFGVMPFYLLAFWLNRRGRVRLAAYLPVITLFLAVVGANYQVGVGHVVLIGYAMVTLTAGILIGSGTALFFALISMAAHVVGGLPGALAPETTVMADGIGGVLGLIVLVMFNWLSNREMSQMLGREQELTANLRAHRTGLEQRVAARTAELTTANERLELEIAERKRAEEAQRRKTLQQEQLLETARYLTASLDFKEVLTRIGIGAKDILEAYGCAIYLLEADGRTLNPVVAVEPPHEEEILSTPLDVDTSFTGQAVKVGRGMIFNDAAADLSGQQIPGTPVEENEHVIVSPFIVDGKVLGAMCLSRIGNFFTGEDLALAETFATYAATALKNAQTHHELQQEVEERKRTEEALRESEGRYRLLAENVRDVIWIRDVDNLRYTYMSPSVSRLRGYTVAEAMAQTIEETLTPASLQVILEALAEEETTEGMEQKDLFRSRTLELEMTCKDGSTVWTEVTMTGLRDSDGRATGVLGVSRDITERKQAEAEREGLLASEREQRILAETLAEVTLALTSQIGHEAVLDEILRQVQYIVPYSTASIVLLEGDRLRSARWQGYKAFDSEEFLANLAQPLADLPLDAEIVRSGQPLVIADTHQDPRWVVFDETAWIRSFLAVPICLRNRVLGLLRLDSDIPGEFSAKDAQRLQPLANAAAIALENARLFAATRRQAEQLEALRQVSQDLAALRDLDTLLQHIVEQAIQLLGVDAGGMYLYRPEREVLEYVVTVGEQPTRLGVTLERGEGLSGKVWTTSEPLIVDDYRNWSGKSPKWSDFPIGSAVGVPIQWGDEFLGALNLWTGNTQRRFTSQDATLLSQFAAQAAIAIQNARLYEQVQGHAAELEQRVAERTRELAEANERLQELDQLKSRFVSDVSHELRTPIANVKLYLHLLERGDTERRSQYLAILKEQSDRLAKLIENILNLSRLDLGGDKVEFAPVDLNNVVEQVVTAHQPRAELARLDLVFEPGPALPPVRAERNQLSQVVTNLVGNAINYTDNGRVQVVTYLAPDRRQACLEVKDTGMGIEPEDMPHLYERFYRGQRIGSSNIPGTGLGLAIVKEIVNLHGGRIEVESRMDEGTSFRVWLPIEANDS